MSSSEAALGVNMSIQLFFGEGVDGVCRVTRSSTAEQGTSRNSTVVNNMNDSPESGLHTVSTRSIDEFQELLKRSA